MLLHLTLNETCNDEDLPALLTRIAAQHQLQYMIVVPIPRRI